ncbi:hypothetical protein LC653_31040 [Nostoc sp. CHAB 5784]|nr:hypothetical protein [Nostoc mirabile CHAB5784]
MTTALDLSKFLYCRHCEMKTHHYKDLKYDWGYSCRICRTWQHQAQSAVLESPQEEQLCKRSQLISIQQGYAAKAIIEAIGSEYVIWHDGTLEQFIEAAQALDMEYDYQKTIDGYDFKAWYPDDEDNEAKIQL